MDGNYWTALVNKRASRRRALGWLGGGVAGAAFLAACGGGSDEDKPAASSLLGKPTDSTSKAKRGGRDRTITFEGRPSHE